MARSLIVRALWFVFVGWWLTFFAVLFAWLLNLTIIGIPFGIKVINRVPTILTLKEPRCHIDPESGATEQYSLLVRAVYFVFVGWWLSLVWTNAAWAISVTVIGLPIGIIMFNYLPFVTSLYRFDG
jgi:uncharacterized membrane protein YccF (DUF307 family)